MLDFGSSPQSLIFQGFAGCQKPKKLYKKL